MNEWIKLRAIIQGFKNLKFSSDSIEKIAKERAVICAKCEHSNTEHPFKLLLEDQSTQDINGMGCNICHCLLSAKVRQLFEGCPLKKWN